MVEQHTQTDIGSNYFDRESSLSKSSKKVIEDPPTDFPLRYKLGKDDTRNAPRAASRMSGHREDDFSPANLKSVYDEPPSDKSRRSSNKSHRSSSEMFPEIRRKSTKNRSPSKMSHVIPDVKQQGYSPGPSPQIKQSLKQAISRRKNDYDFY